MAEQTPQRVADGDQRRRGLSAHVARRLMNRRSRHSTLVALATRVALLATLIGLVQGLLIAAPPAFAAGAANGGPHPSHNPNTLSLFQASGTATGKGNRGANASHALKNPGPMNGVTPDKAPPTISPADLKPVEIPLDTRYLATTSSSSGSSTTATPGSGIWASSSDGVIDVQLASNSVDLSAATVNGAPVGPTATPTATPIATPIASPTATATTTPTATPPPASSPTAQPTAATTATTTATTTASPSPSPSNSPTPSGSPGATSSSSASSPISVSTLATQLAPTPVASAAQTGSGASGFTLELKQTAGSYRGDGVQLGAYTLHVLDSQQRELQHVKLRAPIQIRFHYGAEDLSGVNTSDLRLVWPSTANKQANRPAASVPLSLDSQAHTLTATVSTLYAGPMLMAATLSDANAASSEHPLVAGNTGDLTFSLPLDTPPAAGGLAPNLTLSYSSAGPNGRNASAAPAPWTGDGWDLNLGSITYDATTGLFYLNGVAGENEPLLCCVVNAAQGNLNYFVPHHHNNIHITTTDNSQHPNTTGSAFTLRTPDGTEYKFGATPDSLRSTVTGGAKTYYEWDLSAVYRHSSTSSTYLQEYTVSYWQDLATSGSFTYVRDAAPRVINYNYVGGNPQGQIWFNIHWPGATTTNGSATATSYGTNYHCSGSSLVATTLRCDDPVTPSGYEAAPLTMTTITLDSVVMQTYSGSQWQNVRSYTFGYAPDRANGECWDDVTGVPYACSGEHLLTSVQETPYQNNAAEPSQQPITFAYTGPQKNEYHDDTINGFDGNPFDEQTWWQYLTSFSDAQTGASDTVAWQTAWGNTHGVPSGSNVFNPWTCSGVTCSRADDRQWMRQTVGSITDVGDNNATTSYSYVLNAPCGSGCTQDTWIAPNGWNACGSVAQGPTYPNGSCLISGPYTNYYNELFTGFIQVYVTDPSGATNYTQYHAGDGWGTNDWQFPNAYEGFPVVEQTYAGAASGAPLEEVDHLYTESNCPPIDSAGNQLYVANLMLCDTWETQRDTWIGGASGTSGVPHSTETWSYDPTVSPALGLQYNGLTADAITTNDALSDSISGPASYGSTQPTFTTHTTTVRHDGALDSPNNYYYLANLPAQVTLDDSAGNRWTCQQISYDSQGYTTGESAGLTDGLPTRVDQWANCGTSGNGYSQSGVVTTGTGYNAYGQPIVTTDADALAGIGGHTGCTAHAALIAVYPTGASNYTTCTQEDSAQNVYPTSSWNALDQASSATYDVTQGVATSSTDANGVTTTYGGPVYEYNGSPSLANFQDVYTQTTLPGEILGGSSPWTTRVFAYSFCAGATGSTTSPCLEVDTVRQSDASDTLVSRAFYDRDGRQVETRTTSPVSGQDSVTITAYNDANHSQWSSLVCTTATLTTGNGGRTVSSTPYYIAPTQTSAGSSAWVNPAVGGTGCSNGTLTGTTTWADALNRTVATDDPLGTGVGASGTGCVLPSGSMHHTTCVAYQPVVASATAGLPGGDGEPYLQAVSIDGNLHQQASYTDALGRVAYTQEYSGASQQPVGSGVSSYAVTANQYDPMGTLRQVTDPQGHITTFTDDALGRQTALQDPNRGAESYSYDANGAILQTVDARGASGTIDAGYDGLNRQLWRNTTNSASGAYVTYSYDSTASGNDGKGRLTGESFANSNVVGGALTGSYAYTYDSRGRTTATVETVDETPYTTSATYNDLDQLATQTYPDGDVVTSVYTGATGQESALNLLQNGASGSVGLLTNESYSGQAGAAGLLTGATLSAFTSGSGTYSASYDGLLRLTSAAYSYTPSGGSATTLSQAQPTYDAVSNVTSETTTLPQGTDTQAFCYDAQNRLIWAGTSGTAPCGGSVTPGDSGSLAGSGASYSASYAYDTLNRLTNSPLGSYSYGASAHVDAATAVGSAWTASYDAAGNMTCRAPTSATTCAGGSPTGAQLAYDNEGRLTAWQNTAGSSPTSSLHDLYDGEGHRVAEQVISLGSGDSTATTAFIGGLQEVTTSSPNVAITGFTPSTGPVGSSVSVTGSGFSTTPGATSVAFNGVLATSVSVTSASQLSAVVPAGASSGPISVSTSLGTATSAGDTPSSFTVAATPPAPTISGFSPANGPVGAIVTLLGAHFTGASSVRFNGVAATSFSVVSDSQLTATVPTGATTGPLSVTTGGGVATTSSVYTVSAAPPDTLFGDNFEPDALGAAPAGWSVTSGTWAVESDGTHVLQQTDTGLASSVYITANVAGSASWTDYTVSADVKPGADNTSGTVANLMGRYTDSDNHYSLILKNNSEWWLGVKQAGNWSTIDTGTFSYNSSTFYTLTLSLQGSTITGSIDGTVVGSGTDTTFTSGGIGFSTAANSEIDNVSVVDGTGQGGGSPPPAPTLTSFTPSSGAVGTTVTLSGSGFTNASSVAFNGTLASRFTVVSDSQLTAVVPSGATSGPLSVTTPGGSATSSASFSVNGTPPPPPPSTTTTTAYYGGGIAESVNGTLSYLLSDPVLGSASASVSTTSGQVVASQLFSPYGGVRYASGILPTDIGFTHQRADATSGLDDYGARWYDPVAGQFASADTTLSGGLNRYAYVAGNPETNTDPSGHLYAPPRNTSRSLAMWQSQNQPHTYYGSVKAFVTGLPQFLFGTDTLRQAFHTIFQNPKASLGDKVKAAGVAGFTIFTDAVTIGSLAVGEPEVGADLRTFDEGLLAANDAKGVVAATTEVTTEVATEVTNEEVPSLLRAGSTGGAKLPMNMDTVKSVSQKYGIDISENNIKINKIKLGPLGSTGPDQSITLYRNAFINEEELAKTLVHEQYHVSQLQAGMPYPDPSYNFNASVSWEQEAEAAAQAWWNNLER